MNISKQTQQIIDVLAYNINSVSAVCEQLQIKTSSVFGSLAVLKKHELAVYEDGMIYLTDKGKQLVTPISKNKQLVVFDNISVQITTDKKEVVVVHDEVVDTEVVGGVVTRVKSRPGTKKMIAWGIIESMSGSRHKDVLAALMEQMDISKNNACAYIHNYKVQH